MGPGIRPLPFFHPLQIATDCAVCDHLTGGRYIAGFGVGINAQSNKQRGTLVHDPRVMFREAVGPDPQGLGAPAPFDWNGTVWQGEKWHIIPKPMSEMEVGIACSRSDTTLELTAEKGFLPLMSWTPTVPQIREMLSIYMRSDHKRGRRRRAAGRGSAGWSMSATRSRRPSGPARRRAQARLQPHAARDPAGRQQRRSHLSRS
jgi:alkanesulfonate monooxygenase SsuD/methylene tetrahydromethanopterin reductase-like flavin-dependent oxidoreductase (luciferase family)